MEIPHKPAGTQTLGAACAVNWLEQAFSNVRSRWGLCAGTALLVLLMRVTADYFGTGGILFLSYLTDALIFVAATRAFEQKYSLWKGLRSLSGRKKSILLTSLWGLSSAAMGEATFVIAEPAARAMVVLSGQPWLGSISGLLILLTGTYLAMLLLTGGVLAGLDAAEPDGGFKVSGTWGLLSAWRMRKPLAATFMAFISITVAYFLTVGLGLKRLFPENWEGYALLASIAIGLMLFAAVSTFVAMLPAIMAEARQTEGHEYDVSDEQEADTALALFLAHTGKLLRGGGWLLLAASFLISGSMTLIHIGLILLVWGFACRRSAVLCSGEQKAKTRYLPLILALCASGLLFLSLSG